MVFAVKYDSPQRGHDHMGMASMTSKEPPLPKLRVTYLSWTVASPQYVQHCSAEIDCDDNEPAGEADFDDRFGCRASERGAGNDALDFAGLRVTLSLGDSTREDEVFEIEDREVVIFEFVRGMGGYDVVERSNQVTELIDGELSHAIVLGEVECA